MRLLVAGGSGFIGRHLRVPAEYEVFYLTRTNLAEVERFGPELVLNLAWEGVSSQLRSDLELQRKNLDFNEALFNACKGSCKRWVGVGSQAEVNSPSIPYAACKNLVRASLISNCLQCNIQFVWIRIFSTYGPGDNPNNYIPYLIRELESGKDPELTDQNIPWDYLYVEDATAAITLVLSTQESGVFELGSGETVMTQDVARLLRDKINPKAILQFGKKPKRSVEIDYLCANIERLVALGWRPVTSLEAGLSQAILSQ